MIFARRLNFKVPAAAWTIIVQGLNLIGQLAVDVMIARMLGPQIAGEVIFAFSVSGMLSIFALFGSGEIAIQLYNQRRVAPQQVMTAVSVILGLGTALCMILGFALSLAVSLPWEGKFSVMAALLVLSINGMSSVMNHAIVSWDLSKQDMSSILISRLVMVVGVALAASVGSLMGVWGAYVVGALVQCLWRARIVDRHAFTLKWSFDGQVLADLWRRGKHVGISSIFGTIATRADMPILRVMAGAQATGLYGAAYRIVSGINMLSGSTAFALFPFLSRPDPDGKLKIYRKLYQAIPIVGSVCLWFSAAFFAEPVAVWVFGPSFIASGVMLKWLLIAASFQLMQSFLARYVIVWGYEQLLPRAQLLAALTNLGMLLWLAPRYGAMGAVWATLGGDLVALLGLVVGVAQQRSLRWQSAS